MLITTNSPAPGRNPAARPGPVQRVVTVFIVDDHPVTRDGLACRLAIEPDLATCGEAADLADALRDVSTLHPDVAVIDLGLRRGDGLDLVARLKARGCPTKMLVWSWRSESLYAERALRAGAAGYIGKDEATTTIVNAIRHVMTGGVYLSPHMMGAIVRRTVAGLERDVTPDPLGDLSNRELEVFRLTGQGMDTAQVAGHLNVSPKTVETYKARVREKLGLDSGGEMLFRPLAVGDRERVTTFRPFTP